jgi:hypothetical protein
MNEPKWHTPKTITDPGHYVYGSPTGIGTRVELVFSGGRLVEANSAGFCTDVRTWDESYWRFFGPIPPVE